MKNWKFLLLILIIGGCLSLFSLVLASSLGISIDKTAIVADFNAGLQKKFVIEVKNISDQTQKIELYKNNYEIGDNNELLLVDSDIQTGLRKWIVLNDKEIIIKPGSKKNISFILNVPKDALLGSHQGVIVFRAVSENSEDIKIQGQIGVHILVNIKGDTKASGHIDLFRVPLFAVGLIKYVTVFENTGNVHYVPTGKIIVENIFTNKKQVYNYDKHFVFPGKKFTFSHVEKIPSSFGFYKVRVLFLDGDGNQETEKGYVVGYFFPALVVIALILVSVFLWLIKRK